VNGDLGHFTLNFRGVSPLSEAAKHDSSLVELLLSHGADVNGRLTSRSSARPSVSLKSWTSTAIPEQAKSLKLLLAAGYNINVVCEDGYSLLTVMFKSSGPSWLVGVQILLDHFPKLDLNQVRC